MAKIAVDVVLLPSETMADKVIEANRRLPDKRITLSKEGCLPHISLAMGCIEQDNVRQIEGILSEIAEQFAVGRLKIADIHLGANSLGERVSSFEIERTEAIQSLHEQVMQRLKLYLSYDVTADMLLAPPISESTLRWIAEFPEKSAYANFFPHITIGYGEMGFFSVPAEFSVSKLALCRLGNHCTCRKVLSFRVLGDIGGEKKNN
ncbi:MAG: hypothetical protein JXN61_04815 [Sedimentisphaerales bacterium]|nr:hypothetical protein [Sedimentisphaerales bacterium]